ncbi:MAG: fructose-specific PTS transporter subunit EIIC, partial [Eubacterium sp.]|nr:fructose-specific PTS transporter subunit EIIC [Eubacterium sp.]
MAIDMGGPFNKAAYVFGTGMLTTAAGLLDKGVAVTDPKVVVCYEAMAAVMIGGMVPPIAIALSTTLFKDHWNENERKNGVVNYIMGLSFITEGAIPYAASYPLKVIPACMIGSGVAGFLSWLFKCQLMAPHGGIFVFATVKQPLLYILSLVIGSAIACIILTVLKGKNKEE